MAKKDENINTEIQEEVAVVTPPVENTGRYMTAVDYAMAYSYGMGIAGAVKTLDHTYNFRLYESDWEKIFSAYMDKPSDVAWKDYYKG